MKHVFLEISFVTDFHLIGIGTDFHIMFTNRDSLKMDERCRNLHA